MKRLSCGKHITVPFPKKPETDILVFYRIDAPSLKIIME